MIDPDPHVTIGRLQAELRREQDARSALADKLAEVKAERDLTAREHDWLLDLAIESGLVCSECNEITHGEPCKSEVCR